MPGIVEFIHKDMIFFENTATKQGLPLSVLARPLLKDKNFSNQMKHYVITEILSSLQPFRLSGNVWEDHPDLFNQIINKSKRFL